MKKNILYITLVVFMSTTMLSSCAGDWLDREPSTALPREIAITNLGEAFAALNGMYDAVQGTSGWNSWYGSRFIVHGDVRGDDMQARAAAMRSGPTYLMQYVAGTAPTLWIQPYRAINRANNLIQILEETDEILGLTDAVRDDMIGQALAVRALAHFDLLRLNARPYTATPITIDGNISGGRNGLGVPIITIPPAALDTPARNTIGEVYDQIVADLLKAIDLMFEDRSNILPYRGATFIRGWFNAWSAKALLARVYLYMGNFTEAYRFSTEVIAGSGRSLGEFTLNPDGFIDDWMGQIRSEILFEIVNYSTDDWVDREAIGYLYAEAGYEDAIMTQAFINLMETYYADDLRWGVMLPSRRNPDASRPWNIVIPANADQGIAADTIWNRVFINKWHGRGDVRLSNIPILRLSEMYLIAAEAAYQNNNPTSAAAHLNAIVLRGNPDATPVTPADANLDRILQERRVEFVGEGHRFFDLMRTNRRIVRYNDATDIGWHLPLSLTARNFDNTYFRAILPIPEAEMNANPNMVQNPGY